jgi:hypothetical protein
MLAIQPVLRAGFDLADSTTVIIGNPAPTGSSQRVTNGLDLIAGGRDIGGTADQCVFTYQIVTGDFDVSVRLEALGNTDLWAKAGLMLRETAEPGSPDVGVFATPTMSGCLFQSRTTAGGNTGSGGNAPVSYPYTWLRLQRLGDVVTGYAGFDGQSWSALGTASAGTNLTLLGVAATSHNSNQTTLARLRDLGQAVAGTNNAPRLKRETLGPANRRTGLVITEIMYHPPQRTDGRLLEFIELFNSESIPMNLDGFKLSGAIDYTFPSNLVMGAGGFLVVAKSPADVAAIYGLGQVLGGWSNGLPGDTGTVRLENAFGGILCEVQYSSAPPWPKAADGAGHSLVLTRPSLGESDPQAWSASAWVGGSPGADDPANVSPLNAVRINEILANSGADALDFVELYNHGGQALDLGGCVLTDDPATNRFRIPANTQLAPGGFVAFRQNELGFGLKSSGESIYLITPDGRLIVDAVRFPGQDSGASFGRFPDGTDDWHELRAPSPETSNQEPQRRSVVINEIMYHPISGNDDDQYVELYNRGTNAIDLGGWRFIAGIDFTFPAHVLLPVNGYLVIAKNASWLRSRYPNLTAQNTLGDFQGKLSHNGETLALAMPLATVVTNQNQLLTTNVFYVVVNEVAYGTGGRWGSWSDGGGSSLELIDARADNRLPSNWADSDETAKSQWTLVEHTGTLDLGVGAVDSLQVLLMGAGECLIDNVEVLAAGGTNLIANSTFDNGVSGWFMQGTHERSSWEQSEGYDRAGSLHLRADGRGDTGANRIRTSLFNPRPAVGTAATIRARVRWLRGDTDILLRFRGNWLEAAGTMGVPANLGTPGAKNSCAAANTGPAIHGVAHYPILPAAQQDVVVTAQVNDPDGIARIILNYRLDPDTTIISLPMVDDGSGGDAVARDGVFSATIPGQAAGVMVAFHVDASDGFSPSARALFPADAPVRECLVRFGESQPLGNIGTYRVWLTKSTTSKWTSRLKLHNTLLDATFVYGNQRVIYNVGACYAGSPFVRPGYSGPAGAACGYELEFPADDRFLGDNGMTLDYPVRDDTLQLEQVAYWMADQLGVANNHRRFVNLIVNGSKRAKIYEDCQRPDKDLLHEFYAGDADGDLFKLDDGFEFDDAASSFQRDNGDTAATLENFTTTDGEKKTARYRWHWRKRAESGSTHDYASLFALVDAMNARSDAYDQQVHALVDLNQWARVLAVEHMVGNWDSYGYQRGKNMFAYKPNQGKWQLVMWDIDFVMSAQGNSADTSMFGAADPVINHLFNNAAFARTYYQAMRTAIDGPLARDRVEPLLDAKYAALIANGITAGKPNAAKTYIQARRDNLIRTLNSLAIDFVVANNDGHDFSAEQNWVQLVGTAPIDIQSITINGVAYPMTWQNAVVWSVRLPLNAATNHFAVLGFDAHGKLWSNSPAPFTITYTGPPDNPRDFLAINEIMYRPTAPGTEFVELFNASDRSAFDLSNWRLEGLAFTFAPGTVIGPRDYLVLTRDRTKFMNAYGSDIIVTDVFSGRLNPGGETLRLVQPGSVPASDSVIDEVSYSSQFPWPSAADGQGGSLQLLNRELDHQLPANWGAITPAEAAQLEWRFVSVTGIATSNSHLLIYHSPYQEPRPYNDISGNWSGFIDIGSEYSFTASFQAQSNGWSGTVNLGSDIPLTTIKVETNRVRFGFNYGTAVNWDGRLTPDGNTLKGTFSQPGSSFPFTLRRQTDPRDYPGGEIFLDDLSIVAGSAPAAGVNLVQNGEFESALASSWHISSNHAASATAGSAHHSGQNSLHLVATFGGKDEESAVWQAVESLVPGQVYTLSYWYLPSNKGRELTVRLGDSDINISHAFAPATAATPGAPNSISAKATDIIPVQLTEIQPENVSGITDANGHRTAWVELYNTGAQTVSLQNCFLSTFATNLQQWAFPSNATIAAHQYAVVWLDGLPSETTAVEWHADFLPAPTNGLVILSHANQGHTTVIDSLDYQHVSADRSYGSVEDHDKTVFSQPTPGQANQIESGLTRVLINEWLADNTGGTVSGQTTTRSDWFELFNPAANVVDLSGFTLTDDLDRKNKYVIPTGTLIPAQGFLVVWADGLVDAADGALHVGFKLSKEGETIGLFNPVGTLVDAVGFGPQTPGISQGRWPDGSEGAYTLLQRPTPGAPNIAKAPELPLTITGFAAKPGLPLAITWNSNPNQTYQLQLKNNLTDPSWQNLRDPIIATTTTTTSTDPSPNTTSQRFYRVTSFGVSPGN